MLSILKRRDDPAVATGGFGFIQCLIGGLEERRALFDAILTLGHANATGHVKRRAVCPSDHCPAASAILARVESPR